MQFKKEIEIVNQSFLNGFLFYSSCIGLDSIQQALIDSAIKRENGESDIEFVSVKQPFDYLIPSDPCIWLLRKPFKSKDLDGISIRHQLKLMSCYDAVIELPTDSHIIRSYWRLVFSTTEENTVHYSLFSQWVTDGQGNEDSVIEIEFDEFR